MPELRPPTYSRMFSSIFENMPPPAPYNASEPKREGDPVWPMSLDGKNEPHGGGGR